jgi:hypothetical protein
MLKIPSVQENRRPLGRLADKSASIHAAVPGFQSQLFHDRVQAKTLFIDPVQKHADSGTTRNSSVDDYVRQWWTL